MKKLERQTLLLSSTEHVQKYYILHNRGALRNYNTEDVLNFSQLPQRKGLSVFKRSHFGCHF